MSQSDVLTSNMEVTLDGKPIGDGEAVELRSVEVRVSTYRVSTIKLTIDDFQADDKWLGKLRLGATLQASVIPADGRGRASEVLTAPVRAIEVSNGEAFDGRPFGPRQVVVKAHDLRHSLSMSSHMQALEAAGPRDGVIKDIAKRNGLTAQINPKTKGTDLPVLQADSDLEMLNAFARLSGCEWWVHGEYLFFGDPPWPVVKLDRYDLHEFSVSYDGELVPKNVRVRGWDPKGEAFSAEVKADLSPDAVGSDAPFVRDLAKSAEAKAPEAGLDVTSLHASDKKAAEVLAGSVARNLAGRGMRARGRTDARGDIHPGGRVEVTGFGRLDGMYRVREVVMRVGMNQGLSTEFECGWGDDLVEAGWEPPNPSSHWVRSSPVIGIVTGEPDELGRVPVLFPSLSESAKGADKGGTAGKGEPQSVPARVVSPGSGPESGLVIAHRLGDEVLVGFERGDPTCPVILGGLWNDKGPRPPASDYKTTQSITSPDGQVIALVDDKVNRTPHGSAPVMKAVGKGGIYLGASAQGSYKTFMAISEDKGVVVEVPSDQKIIFQVGKDATLTLDNKGLKLETKNGKFVVDAMAIEMAAKQAVKMEGKAGFEAKGATVKVEGKATVDVKSSGMLNLKGTMTKIN